MEFLNNSLLITDPIYRQTALIVLAIIFGSGLVVYSFRTKNFYFKGAWASIKSWLFVAPLMFVVFSFPSPAPLIVLTLMSVYGAKAFFQIMGDRKSVV